MFLAFCFLWCLETQKVASDQYYEVFFPPKDKCLEKIVKLIGGAQKHIYLQCYSFTSKIMAAALIKAHGRGVDVQIISDKSQLKAKGSVVLMLSLKKIPVYIDHRVSIAHNKTMIIDGRIVLTGSYNWTNAAENRNAENLIVFYNHKGIVGDYQKNWINRKTVSRKLTKDFLRIA